ncbi:MAG: hypothetical protein MUC92_12000 [Fimbriimonadaceae bacterium]|jgi:hypothetical protein|nr:hypothetical protein [Fimbriimonadaceae bacterium]
MASFDIPLNLPHAAKVAQRLVGRLDPTSPKSHALAQQLAEFLNPCAYEEPSPAEAVITSSEALALLQLVVAAIVEEGQGNDRVGQAVRNLYECLERGEEGARQGLVAGEDPRSPQRPV